MYHFLLLFLYISSQIEGRKNRAPKLRTPLEENPPDEVQSSLVQREILTNSTNTSAKEIVKNYNQIFALKSLKNFQGSVIAFVTPWNPAGMEIARKFRTKFNIIVPTWYDLKLGVNGVTMERSVHFNKKWLASLKKPDETGISNNVLFIYLFLFYFIFMD
jgi:chitinase domain-containing protein 1